jgi:RNA polymerase sigma-70 factor (ECF subfamily)
MRGITVSLDERRLVRALRAGDERAYAELHEEYDARLTALAVAHGCSRAVAQEVVQETWTAVVRNIHAFEGRSSFKTWLFRILVNAATAHAERERRQVPVSTEVVVDLEHARNRRVALTPDEQLVLKETVEVVHAAIGGLSSTQRQVIALRDLHGWSAEDVSGRLGISRGHQRVLLHRARAHVRRALEAYGEPKREAA